MTALNASATMEAMGFWKGNGSKPLGMTFHSHRIHGNDIFTIIYLHEWLIFMVTVGKYTSPMDSMGLYWLVHEVP